MSSSLYAAFAAGRFFEMTFVARDVIKLTYTLQDQEKSSEATFYIGENTGNLPNIHDAAFRAFIGEFGDNLTALSDCFVSAININLALFNDAAITFGDAPDRERKAVLQFATEDGFQSKFSIPGAKYTMFGADGVTITRSPTTPGDFAGNPLEVPLESVHDKLRNGVTVGAVTYPVCDRRAKDLRDLRDAYKLHESNSRG